jgi:hypothetical protein
VTTCSPRNNNVVKSAGASLVFDYRDPLVVAKIVETVPDLRYAFDTIGNATSSTMAAEAMGSNKGNICTVRPGKQYTENIPKHILVTDVLVFTAFLKPHVYKKVYKWPVSCFLLCFESQIAAPSTRFNSYICFYSKEISHNFT